MASHEKPGFLRGPTTQAFLAGGLLLFSCSIPFALRGKNPLSSDITEIDLSPTGQPASENRPVFVEPGCTIIAPNDTVSDAFTRIGESYNPDNRFRIIYSPEHGGGQKTFSAESPEQIDKQGVVVWPGDKVCSE